uniref:Chlororespiratory reduction 21 n=1 Tax=Cypripedium formosanum TaxID=53042 RepID=A0A0F7J3U7_9ASPA|nr:chlororespiratory reduction 21 [Cypripedium formosanum]
MASISFPSTTKAHSSKKIPNRRIINSSQIREIHLSLPTKKPKNLDISSKCYLQEISSLCKEGQLEEAFSLLSEMDSYETQIGPEIFGEILQGCVYMRALSEGQQIHARLLKSGPFFHKNEYLETKLLVFYAKCDCLVAAEELFFRQKRPNVFSWSALIGLQSRHGFSRDALMSFCKMMEIGDLPDNFVLPNALKACLALGLISFGKGIHGYAIKVGFRECVYVLSSLVDVYGKCGALDDALKVFEEIPERNVVSWNSLMVGFVQNGIDEEALRIFLDMRIDGIQPTRASVASFLSASANLLAVDEGRQGHAVAVLLGLELDGILGTSMINFYCKVGLIEHAELIFRLITDRDEVTWNVLISGYVEDGQTERALNACHHMRRNSFKFDCVTLANILSACAYSCKLALGRIGHGYCIRNNLELDLVVASNIINMYASCDRILYAERVFNTTKLRDLVLWNTMISAYAQYGLSGQALRIFYQMQLEGVPPNVRSWNLIFLAFLRNGQAIEAQDMFALMKDSKLHPNLVTWTTLICGFARNGYGCQAIQLFIQMQSTGIRPNSVCIIGVLLACANVASLRFGMAVHGHVLRKGFLTSLCVTTSLVDMYAKCGSIEVAREVFEKAPKKTLPLYNALISGYSLYGQFKEALELYNCIQEEGLVPDCITFTGLLSACSHSGLVNESLKIFDEMVSTCNISPQKEHYGCILSLLARYGNFKDAIKVMSEMPFKPDAHMFGSLLAACKEFGGMEFGEALSNYLFRLEPTNSANLLALANIYATSGRWKEALDIRAFISKNGLQKNPGWSWIEVENELHVFAAEDGLHPKRNKIRDTLLCLHKEMKLMECWSTMNSTQIDVK